MEEWEKRKAKTERYLPEIKRIIGEHLICTAPLDEDTQRCTDLIVLRLNAIRIACRVRDNKYLTKYGDEFTIRSRLINGKKTELAKIVEGWADYLFYGFSDETEQKLAGWLLGDLSIFRLWFNSCIVNNGGRIPGEEKLNHDGLTYFRAFGIDDIWPEFIIARRQAA